MDWTCVGIMAVGFVVAMVGMKQQKNGVAWGQALAIVGAIIALGGAGWNLSGFFRQGSMGMAREKRYMYLQAKFLAEEVAKLNPKKVCVICAPEIYLDTYGDKLPTPVENDWMNGIQDALKGVEIVPIYPTYKREKPKADPKKPGMDMPPMPYTMLTAKDYDTMCKQIEKEKADAVINIYQFPMGSGMNLLNALKKLKCPNVAFLNSSSDDELKLAFQNSGNGIPKVVAVVMTKVNAVYDDTIPRNDKKAFDRRFVLVTDANGIAAASAK